MTRLRYRPEITWTCTGVVSSATVVVARTSNHKVAATGQPTLNFHYRVNNGRWHWATGNAFALHQLALGSTTTVHARAVDIAGNIDPHTARSTFRVRPARSANPRAAAPPTTRDFPVAAIQWPVT